MFRGRVRCSRRLRGGRCRCARHGRSEAGFARPRRSTVRDVSSGPSPARPQARREVLERLGRRSRLHRRLRAQKGRGIPDRSATRPIRHPGGKQQRPFAVSSKGAQGLMQLMPATARRFSVKNSFNPWENIDGGVRYLKYLLTLFGGKPIARVVGPGGVQRRRRRGHQAWRRTALPRNDAIRSESRQKVERSASRLRPRRIRAGRGRRACAH